MRCGEAVSLIGHTGQSEDTHSPEACDETAKAELKSLMPEDAKEAIGHGIRAKRSKSGCSGSLGGPAGRTAR
jgi:hypothetical protein